MANPASLWAEGRFGIKAALGSGMCCRYQAEDQIIWLRCLVEGAGIEMLLLCGPAFRFLPVRLRDVNRLTARVVWVRIGAVLTT